MIFKSIKEKYYEDLSKIKQLDFWELPEELEDEYLELFLGDNDKGGKIRKVVKSNKYSDEKRVACV